MKRFSWGVIALTAACSPSTDPLDQPGSEAFDDLLLAFTAVGPDPAEVDAFAAALPKIERIVNFAGDDTSRVLYLHLQTTEDDDGVMVPTTAYKAVLYNYTTDTYFEVHGDMEATETITSVEVTPERPAPTLDEVEDGIKLMLDKDPVLAARVAAGEVEVFRAMPPLLFEEGAGRRFPIGIRETHDPNDNEREILGIDLGRQMLLHYEGGTPPTSSITGFVCNPAPSAGQTSVGRGAQAFTRLTATDRNGNDVWSMLVARPSGSTGTDGSGVDIQDVLYRGKRVLAQGHVPILNVSYTNNACGPYRDWQWQESPFEIGTVKSVVNGTSTNGFVVTDYARTMVQNRVDDGNFVGVAAYVDRVNQQAVLLSELTAGWYRYSTEWRFSRTGEINARFGFDAVENYCTCREHFHHNYWRLDFDIGSGNNRIEQYDDGTGWQTLTTEGKTLHNSATNRHWRVSDPTSGDSVLVYQGEGQDAPDAYGNADMWFLRQRASEIDDRGVGGGTEARLDNFVNGESIDNADVMIWAAGHFVHDDTNPNQNQTHTVQVRIVPENW